MEFYQLSDDGKRIRQESMVKALGIDLTRRRSIAFVGAGGKTTSIHHLANELVSLGKRVIITTTTHMYLPAEYGVLREEKELLSRMLDTCGIAVVGRPCTDGKMKGVSDCFYQWMKTTCDYLLIEADGSKRLPIKVTGEHEPVLPEDVDQVVILTGLSCLLQPLMECCHRWKLAMELLSCEAAHKIKPSDVAVLLVEGYCIQLTVPYHILLNQCESHKEQLKAIEIVNELKEFNISNKNVLFGNYTRR